MMTDRLIQRLSGGVAKKLTAATALLALASGASAGLLASASNESGGTIRLMTDMCRDNPSMHIVYATNPNGTFTAGCWILTDAGDVFAQYGNGQSRIYSGSGWTLAKRSAPAKPAPRKRLPVTEF